MKFIYLAAAILAVCHPWSTRADSPVVFNEIMYHPVTNEAQLEWVELQNQMAVDIDMSGWALDGGIDYQFAAGTIIPAGRYLVIASSPASLGLSDALGPFNNRLSNAGERLRLRNNTGRIMDEITYGVEGDWPVAPDGSGPSLARRRSNLLGADARNWLASGEVGGTPGAENFPAKPPQVLSNTLQAIESNWQFNDSGTDLGTQWRAPNYNDSEWQSGSALFYLGDAPLPAPRNTVLAPGRITYYFRTRFVVHGDIQRMQLQLRPLLDDGAIGYLNGTEVFRINMPPGEASYSTLANGQVGEATYGETINLFEDQILPGTNVLAVEVHQAPAFAEYSRAILDAQPIGYWRLGETSGTATDSASAQGAQNGTYAGFGPATLGQAGPRPSDFVNAQALAGLEADNGAPRFSGNADGGNDVVTIPGDGILNFASTRMFTLEAWVNGGSAQEGGGAIIAKGAGGGGEQFAIDIASGTYRFFAWDGGLPNTAFVANSSIGPNGTWQHLVAVMDQPAGRMKLYVNGVERASTAPRATLINTAHEVSIGARKNSGSANYDLNFDGRIDEVAIYNRALTPAEITNHFNAAFTSNAASGPDTNDVAFGLEIVSAETLPEPEPARIAFNEHTSSTNSAFWVELINFGRTNVNLAGWTIARFGGATNRQYTFAARVLAAGELLQITKTEMGFGADSGDRLVLYKPGGTNVADAFVAKKEPRGRAPDGTGAWWFPNQPTPGASNNFAFRDELVINEIMYHQRELPAVAATYSETNLLLTISNLWKFNNGGVSLGTEWRAPTYDDSSWLASNAVFYAPTNPFTLPAPKNTYLPLTNSAGQRVITYYFRTSFNFSGDTNNLRLALRSIIDDGAVFYLNGLEVHRLNMPSTPISYNTLATVSVQIPGFTGPVLIPAASLVHGLNTLAVEVHQFSTNNSDFDFGTELQAFYELTPAYPFRDSPESWIEIFNRSSNTVDLTGWRIDEGIHYRFTAGRTIAPGGYLVVAKDVAHMQSLYPGLDVVGPFTNRLSHFSDYIALKDPENNLADEVRYFDGGRWAGNADGGGASLELRDPWADNAQAEAWAASDESNKAEWQTFTWRGLSAPGQPGEPTLWRELALCLMDGAGEALLDDISVIETPSTTPRQLISNGGLDAGGARWRFLGNHRHSRVEPEPGNSANMVLHLVASGPGEYQGNQIETTLTNNTAIVDGREYEIAFRAKWLAGKSKLNARLYFNRLARTIDLAVPLHAGTPGAMNSHYAPNLGPTFSDLSHAPVVPIANRPVKVSALVSDPDGVESVAVKYSVAGGAWQGTLTTRDSGERFTATIPGQAAASVVQFYLEAVDSDGVRSEYPAGGTNSRALYVVQDGQAAAPPLNNFRIIMTPADATYMHTGTNTLSNEMLGGTVIYNEQEVFYNVGVRLKGSFVGRNVARVGFHVAFDPSEKFRGVHEVVSVDRSQHTGIGSVGEIVVKHIANHAGGIPGMYDDLARCIAPLSAYTTLSQLRLSGFDADYLDAQFDNGSDGSMFEVEVLRWNLATVDGNPESPKAVGNEGGGTGYANLELQNYGDNKESYRWFLLHVNRRTADDLSGAINLAKTFSLTQAPFDAQARGILDLDEWLRTMAYQELVGPADAYFTGANIHNFRIYVRPVDGKVLYMPWDWDSAFLASSSAPIFGTGNIAKLLDNQTHRRTYLNHMYEILTTTFNSAYMARWTSHYGAVGGQDMSATLNYISARATFAFSQLPTATAFSITSNNGNSFGTSNPVVTIAGTAPIRVKNIEINGVPYALTWTSTTAWTLSVPLITGTNLLAIQGVDNFGNRLTNAFDSITVTNTGPSALDSVIINEWMADNSGPNGFPDPADGLFQDWLELFNPNTLEVSLSGYYLTDNLSQPTKWRIPTNTVIPARGFLLVWADNDLGQNSGIPGTDLHAGFQLSNNGESIGLFAPDGIRPQSTATFALQLENVSEGSFPDGNTNRVRYMRVPTPRGPNQLSGTFQLTRITRDGDTLVFFWDALPGRTYRLEYKTDLGSADWIPVEPSVVGNTLTHPLPSETTRFYRIAEVD